jgi:hypothetical protein
MGLAHKTAKVTAWITLFILRVFIWSPTFLVSGLTAFSRFFAVLLHGKSEISTGDAFHSHTFQNERLT